MKTAITKTAPITALLVFVGFIFLTGGGSRSDIASLAPLRFVAAFAVGAALLFIRKSDLSYIRVPLALLGALALIAVVQLVPLPPETWTALPGREAIAHLDVLVGLEIWRPISLSPFKTANSLAALVVPLAALLWWALSRDTNKMLIGFVAWGVLGALLGLLQLFADPRSGLFFYEVTNRGSATGFFANRNHHSVYLACCVLISLYLAGRHHGRFSVWLQWGMAASAILMALAIIANISRAGLIALFLVVAMSAVAFIIKRIGPGAENYGRSRLSLYSGVIVLGALAALILVLFAFTGRSPALSRLLASSDLADTRDILLPYLLKMVAQFQPLGTGMGAFEYAFRMQEPYELLGPKYINHAHNDWLQFVIEGGVGAVVVVLVSAVFAFVQIARMARGTVVGRVPEATWLGLGLLVVLGTASIVDYPLRVPSIMVLAIIALAMFACPVLRAESRKSGTPSEL